MPGITNPLKGRPTETRKYSVNFGFQPELRAGDTLMAGTATVIVTAGLSPPTLGPPAISGPFVQFTISGGVDGTDYTITCTVTTSSGAVLVEPVIWQCRATP